MYEIAWQEFDRNDRLTTKRKGFKTEAARERFAASLMKKASFYCIIAYRDPNN